MRASFFCKSFSRCILLARLAYSSVRDFSALSEEDANLGLILASCFSAFSVSTTTWLLLTSS